LGGDNPAIRPIGGGTALMLMMKAQLFKPARLVSLRYLGAPFAGIAFSPDAREFRIGAMTTFSELEHHAAIQQHLPVIAHTMKTLANVRVRNVATVGGNLAHADPHLDLPPVWMSLDAEILVVGRTGERTLPVGDLFAGYYETTLAAGELVAELRVPVRPTWRSTYVKVTTRALHDWPAVGLALSVELDGSRLKDLRVVLSAATDRPTRLLACENVLRGRDLGEPMLAHAGEVAADEVDIEGDDRGSAVYKKHLLRVHLARALQSLVGA
jgi:carbon-monoxide dehydrogenase medium subunit